MKWPTGTMIDTTFTVSIDGERAFVWTGGPTEISRVLEDVPRAAEHAGFTPRKFAAAAISHMRHHGIMRDPVGGEMQMMAVLWRILDAKSPDPEHPGKIGDYAGHDNIEADLRFDGRTMRVAIRAWRKFDS